MIKLPNPVVLGKNKRFHPKEKVMGSGYSQRPKENFEDRSFTKLKFKN